MTRREFIKSVLKTISAIAIGTIVYTKKASARRFIRAVRQKKYPGSIKQLSDINTQGKWRG